MTALSLNKSLRVGILAGSLLALSACSSLTGSNISVSQTGDRPAPAVVPAGTEPDDVVIGRREHPRIIAAYGGVYSDRQAEIMVARIVGRLLAASNQPNAQFQVTILDTSEVNAFALPGGYIYVTRGILALASDTSELAAVLAHEIAHVTLRHARARTDKTRTTQIVDRVITGIFGGDVSTDATANRTRQSLAAFGQNQELEADQEGIKFAGKAGYDPQAAARFLGVMSRFAAFSAGTSAGEDGFLSSHPSTPARISKAMDTARSMFGASQLGETDRDGYLAAISGLTFGDSPAQGSIVGQRFIHPRSKFSFTVPQGYALQSAQSAVVGVAGDGEAVRFDSADVQPSMALTDYLKSGWIAGLKADTVKSHNYNGIDMASGLAQTDQWFFRVAVMRLDGAVYRFIFAAKADSARFAQGAESTIQSFRRADASDLNQIRKLTTRIITAKSGDTADTLARQMANIPGGRDLFYILNNLYPGDPVAAGQKYKVVALN
ncbi:MAG: M48 family metalloprotease [Devosia sp.]|jgi:predicted Zn-dependent protease|uniref:M48 family metalloprotease n=1 Tax=unclassified Devosia TaxID=196773 RepID=UPI001A0F71A3|nr:MULTISPECIES: M48 family metalloprotease [unclassified Devosia]MBF0679119.1 M48 family metalloprotease [Devosia sp.]WEJ33733.1 M48 family metalloprotease [Devosia sp. SD17-2]